MKGSALFVALGLVVRSACLAQDTGSPIAADSPPHDQFERLGLREVKLGGELERRIDLTVNGNLLKIDIDKDFITPLLGGHYTGLNDGSGPFIGIGKTLDGMVRLAAYSGNAALIARKEHLVDSIIGSQGRDGYIGMMSPERRTWTLWDLHEQAFIITGLVSDYRLFANAKSLQSARALAEYIVRRWPEMPANWEKTIPIRNYFAELGLSYSFLSLYSVTSDPRYRDFAARELGVESWDLGIVQGRTPPFDGHSYMYLSNCYAQLDLYRIKPDAALLTATERATDFMIKQDGMTITGGAGQDECWTNNQEGSKNLGETCSTAYQIFVFDSMLRLKGQSRWGDLIERNLYNAAFGAQSGDGRRIRYYTPFDGERVYFAPDSYCCPGNFRRLMGVIPELVFYRYGRGLAVNLYTEARTTLTGVGGTTVEMRQETDYPRTGRVVVHVDPKDEASFPLLLRIPAWSSGTRVSVAGKNYADSAKPGEFLRIERRWKRGDTVMVEMPMPWRFIAGRKSQLGRAAVMRGPIVYTLDPERNPGLRVADLKRVVLLPATAELQPDASVRPDGTACRIHADLDRAGTGALTLTLTEFPDPQGRGSYFLIPDMGAAVPDELLGSSTNGFATN